MFIIVPEMAQHLRDYGFKDKEEVYKWLYDHSFIPLKDYRNRSWPDLTTNGWTGIEPTSGKVWKELEDDYMIPLVREPNDNCIIVAGGPEEVVLTLSGGRSFAYGIDAWR